MIDCDEFDNKDFETNYYFVSNNAKHSRISNLQQSASKLNKSNKHNTKRNGLLQKNDFPILIPSSNNNTSSSTMPESFSESKTSYHSSAPTLQRAPIFNTPSMSQINRFSPSNGRVSSPPHPTLFHLGQQLPPACGARQIGKLKRFLTTLVAFGNDIDPSTGERVRNLVFGLVNSTITIEEFQAKLQEATNFPLRPFVTPFLKANLPLLQRELQHCARLVKQTPGQFLLLNENFLYENLPGASTPLPYSSSQSSGSTQSALLAAAVNSSSSLSSSNTVASATTSLFHNSVLKEAMSCLNLPRSIESFTESRKRSAPNPSKEESQERNSSPPQSKRVMSSSPHSTLNHISSPSGSAALNLSTGIHFNDALDNDKDSLLHSLNSLRSNSSYTLDHLGMNQAEEWKHLNDMLKTLPELVLNISHTVRKIEEYNRREREEINCLLQERHQSTLLRSPNERIELKRRIEEAVSDVKRQSKLEMQKVIAATEERAIESIERERNQFEKSLEEIQKKATEDALALMNYQIEDAEHCRNCGRKASETCSGCNVTRYCGSFCQHKDWERHKVECGASNFCDESKPLHVDCEDPENLSIKSITNNISRDSDKESEGHASIEDSSSKKNSKSDNEES